MNPCTNFCRRTDRRTAATIQHSVSLLEQSGFLKTTRYLKSYGMPTDLIERLLESSDLRRRCKPE